MISEQDKEHVLNSSIEFIRAITKIYGSEEGMKMWETISNTIDPEIKGKVFFKLLVGDYSGDITITNFNNPYHKVSFIRVLRTYDTRNLGLKEAKDMCELLMDKQTQIKIQCKQDQRDLVLREFRSLGATCF